MTETWSATRWATDCVPRETLALPTRLPVSTEPSPYYLEQAMLLESGCLGEAEAERDSRWLHCTDRSCCGVLIDYVGSKPRFY
jgi:hypothetical protein